MPVAPLVFVCDAPFNVCIHTNSTLIHTVGRPAEQPKSPLFKCPWLVALCGETCTVARGRIVCPVDCHST